MFRLIMVMFMYCLSFGDAKHCHNATIATSRSLYFSGMANQILHGYGYRNLTGISAISCGKLCLSDTRCFSINYSEREKLCELNGATASQHPEALTEMTGSYYGPEEPRAFCQLHMKGSGVGVDSFSLCCPGQGLRDPIITQEKYAKEDRDGMASACSALRAHICTLAELKEAYVNGYRQPEGDWCYYSVPNRDAKLPETGCGSYVNNECYEGIVVNTPRPISTAPVFCCPSTSEMCSK